MPFPPPNNLAGPLKIDPVAGIRVAQIICIALIMGVVCFLGVAMIVPGDKHDPMIAYIAAGFAVLNIVLRFIVPGIVAKTQLQKLPAGTPEDLGHRLFPIYQTRMIIGMALLEGAAFFNLVAYLVERQLFCLAIVAVLILLMAIMFPTLNQFENWVEDVKRDLASNF